MSSYHKRRGKAMIRWAKLEAKLAQVSRFSRFSRAPRKFSP